LSGLSCEDVLAVFDEPSMDGDSSDSESPVKEEVIAYDDALCVDKVKKFEVLVGDSSFSLFPGLDNKTSLDFLSSVYPVLLAPSFKMMFLIRVILILISICSAVYSFLESNWYEFVVVEILAIIVGQIIATIVDKTLIKWWVTKQACHAEERLELLYGLEAYRYILTPNGPVEALVTRSALHVNREDEVAELRLGSVLMQPDVVDMLKKYNDTIINTTDFDRMIVRFVKFMSPTIREIVKDTPKQVLPFRERVISYTRGELFDDASKGDGRADNVSMGTIKHNNPCYQNYIKRIGTADAYDQQIVVVSKTLITQVISSPPVFNRNDDQQTRDSKLEMCVKNIHTINMKAHLNLDENVLIETIDFLKYYTRYKCRKQNLWSPLLKGEPRAL